MKSEIFDSTIEGFKTRQPFEPFTIVMVSGDRLQVDHKNAIVAHDGFAVLIGPNRVPVFFDNEGVSQIVGELVTDRVA